MAYTLAQIKAKYEQIRDNILNDLATDSGEKFRIASYQFNGQSWSYQSREGALAAVKELNSLIAECSTADGGNRFFSLARVMPTTG